MPIFESVPNISEGRDRQKINALLEVIRPLADLQILDYSSDADHNRSVFTYIGTYAAVLRAGTVLVKKAAEILDLKTHSGVHPRLGVVDVLPIIPVWQADMADAVRLARELGGEIQKCGVPVVFYEYAALNPSERNLADIRRKRYNDRHSTAGLVCVGARNYLVAYNVNLDTANVSVAQTIAGQIREQGGGLRGVKALGLYLQSRSCAQVSMNLVAPEIIGPREAYAKVKSLAEGVGVQVKEEELIGVLPEVVAQEARKLSADIDRKIALLKNMGEKAKEKKLR
ncbi:glutamate formimidoyltransferase [Candidatus Termititenax persephonae]|uniref:glutamate formimidoyltransferase n=1 Tax=Candidatus Termititenax persephonae TaxID=2218525 RepID=A0A388TG56_9BACT|nr:glutamate formimidoyltransferase [Candidatus Termititenax persephonae]